MIVSLVFLGLALLSSAIETLLEASGVSLWTWLPFLLLVAGTRLLLVAYLSPSSRQSDLPFFKRLTRGDKYALGTLLASQVAEVATGRPFEPLKTFIPSIGSVVATLGVFGLVLVLLTIGSAAVLYRSGSFVLNREAGLLQRFTRPARATFVLLVLALAVIGLAAYLTPGLELLTCLMLLALSIGTGLLALGIDHYTGPGITPALGGISPRGWISLGLLSMAALVLGGQNLRLIGLVEDTETTRVTRKGIGSAGNADKPVLDVPSAWSQRLMLSDMPPDTPELVESKRRLEYARKKADELLAKTEKPVETPSPEKRLLELEEKLKKVQEEVANLKAARPTAPGIDKDKSPIPPKGS
jgi:hypothetical protein